MYNGSYESNAAIRVPKGYGGSVSFEAEPSTNDLSAAEAACENESAETTQKECTECPLEAEIQDETDARGHVADTFSEVFGKIVKSASSEDILIIGVAAFLFFSENGDKLYALLLLILLLIR